MKGATAKFVVLLSGEGGRQAGCDHTIACNVNWKWLKAATLPEAVQEVEVIVRDCSGIAEAQIVELSRWSHFDVESVRKQEKADSLAFDRKEGYAAGLRDALPDLPIWMDEERKRAWIEGWKEAVRQKGT